MQRSIEKRYPHFVALVAGRVVGWCDAVPIDRPTRAHTAILGLGVLAEFRGHGIGTALLHEALQAARARGLTRIELSVREGNERVIPLYERFGFVRESVQPNALRIDGRYQSLICMALLTER